jgi:histo-blood group ABO system transferase
MKKNKIGLLIIATNKYIRFLDDLISSADKFFCRNEEVTYFIFTDKDINIVSNRNIKFTKINHKEWPFMTLERYKIFDNNKEFLSEMDYLFYCDADMRFVNYVSEEILGERVGTMHPAFIGNKGTVETNPNSLAYVCEQEGLQYFAGGFNGGTSYEYLKMANKISKNIQKDLNNNIIAIWHDESHLNRYFIDNPPTIILNPSYCYPESWNIPFTKKLLALDKNHQEIRN